MKQVKNVVKLAMKVDRNSARCLDDQSRKANCLYNMLIGRAYTELDIYKETGDKEAGSIVFAPYGLRDLVPGVKEEHPFLKSVHSSPLKNSALRATRAFNDFFASKNGVRKGRKLGRPRYNSWKMHWFSLLYDEPTKGFAIEGSTLKLSLGTGADGKRHAIEVPLVGVKGLKGKIVRNLRIVKEHDDYYAIVTVLSKVPETKPIKRVISFDPNHKNLFYGIDNTGKAVIFEAPHYLKQLDKRIDELRSKLDACKKRSKIVTYTDSKGNIHSYWEGSRKYNKLKKTLNKALAKRRDLTKVFCYSIANWCCRHYDLISIGDYTPQGLGITPKMRRAMNNRSLHGRIKKVISWTALKSGKLTFIYDEKGTTRTCHVCKTVVDGGIKPSIRQWHCLGCGVQHNRDENAAFNGLKKTYENYEKITGEIAPAVPCSGLVHSKEQWACRVLASGVIATGLKQQLAAPPRN